MIIQLNPTMPMLTPKGPALAHFLIDYGEEHHLMWVCVLENTGEIWTYANNMVRAQSNPTFNRFKVMGVLHNATKPDAPADGDLDRQC